MDVLTACVCTAGYWFCLHLSRRDLSFFYWSVRDCVKASLDNAIFLDWTHRSASKMRLIGHAIILTFSACVFTAARWRSVAVGDRTEVNSAGSGAFWGMTQEAFRLGWRAGCTTAVLFFGPMIESWVYSAEPVTFLSIRQRLTTQRLHLLLEYAIAPVSEEVVFRGLNFYLLQHRSVLLQVLLTGLLFGLAHMPKFCYFLCADIRSEAASVVPNGTTENDVRREATVQHTEEGPPETPLRFRPPLSSSVHSPTLGEAVAPRMITYGSKGIPVATLRRIQRSVLKDMVPGLMIPFLFGSAVGTFYLYAYDGGHVAPLIMIHEMCNLFGIPRFRFWHAFTHQKQQRPTALLVGGCYSLGLLLWCSLMLSSFRNSTSIYA